MISSTAISANYFSLLALSKLRLAYYNHPVYDSSLILRASKFCFAFLTLSARLLQIKYCLLRLLLTLASSLLSKLI